MNFQPTNVNPQGLTALIRNLGRDCPPSQYLREFLKNSIEACQRTHRNDCQITLDFNGNIFANSSFYKLAFTDNGDGMSPEQMLSLLNNLSASGSQSNEHQNYGVGAKISAMTRNHAGIQYESWKGSVGYCVFIRYKSEEDIFGVQGFVGGAGDAIYAIPLAPEDKPPMIGEHGTRVTLFGMNEAQDTMHPPPGIPGSREGWMVDYLNTRFFTLPHNIAISARYGYAHPIAAEDQNYLESIEGFHVIADRHCEEKGVMRVASALVYWWIMPEGSPLRGQVALINQGEIFDVHWHWEHFLSQFGIVVGRERVMIYLEPDEAVQNTPRTSLVKPDGSGLNWGEWQVEFRANLPQGLRDFIDHLLNETAQVSHTNAILRRLGALRDLFLLGGYQTLVGAAKASKPKPIEGIGLVAAAAGLVAEEAPPDDPANPSEQPPEGAADEPPQEDEASDDLESGLSFFPKVEWTNEERSPHLVGRAAEYLEVSNSVLANRDFKGFMDLYQFFMQKYGEEAGLAACITSAINESVEQALMECVAGILSLKTNPHWNAHHIHLALTPEALTTSVMQRYWSAGYIDQTVRTYLAQQRH